MLGFGQLFGSTVVLLQANATTTSLQNAFAGLDNGSVVLVAGLLLVLAIVLIIVFRKFIVNSVLGILALIVLNALGFSIGLTAVNIIICGLLGLAGVALLIVLKLVGVPV